MQKRATVQIVLLALAVLALSAQVWARKFALTASQLVPSASGEVNIGTDKNGNTEVDAKVQSLAKPGNLHPPATAYVVWFQQQGSEPTNEGELRVGDNLKGNFKTTTPLKNFDMFITAETDPAIKTPSSQVVLRARLQS